MKPRNKFQKAVAASNERLAAISPKAVEWAVGNVITHIAFRTSGHKCTCGDCGHLFDYRGKGKHARCPACGRKLEVKDTLKRKDRCSCYFSTLEAIDGMQVQRVHLVSAMYRKGRKMDMWCMEVCRMWLNSKGQTAVTSLARTLGYYMDSFNWGSGIELRGLTDVHWTISDTYVYPYYSAIPDLRRNGLKGRMPDCHPVKLMKALLSDSRIETLMKAKDYDAVGYFINHSRELESCWKSYKIARRNKYKPTDFGLWCDMVGLLDRCGRDILNAKYVCPKGLKAEHDRWLKKANAIAERRRAEEQLKKAKEQEKDFYKLKSDFFGIVITDNDMEISVLDTIEAYQTEGEHMKHCVFQCQYYAKKDSIILSAHDHQGNRIETVEFSLSEGKVVQSRGVCNSLTPYHDKIVELVNANAYRFLEKRNSA